MSIRAIGLISMGLLAATASQAAPKFNVSEVPLLPGGTFSSGGAINNAGQATGAGDDSNGNTQAILWDHGVATQIFSPADPHDPLQSSGGVAINSAGVVAGDWSLDGFGGAFAVGPGINTALLSDEFPAVGALNDSNYIVGELRGHPTVWPGDIDFGTGSGLPTTPDNFGASTQLNGINAGNVVVGGEYDFDAAGNTFTIALRWTPGLDTGSGPDWFGSTITVLGGLGGQESLATAINNCGTTVGWARLPNTWEHAVVWGAKASAHDLGTLGGERSSANAVNLFGDVVGQAQTSKGLWHAALWSHKHSIAIDLNQAIDARWQRRITLSGAVGINDRCTILVNGIDKRTGKDATFLLSPTDRELCHSHEHSKDDHDGRHSEDDDHGDHRSCDCRDHNDDRHD